MADQRLRSHDECSSLSRSLPACSLNQTLPYVRKRVDFDNARSEIGGFPPSEMRDRPELPSFCSGDLRRRRDLRECFRNETRYRHGKMVYQLRRVPYRPTLHTLTLAHKKTANTICMQWCVASRGVHQTANRLALLWAYAGCKGASCA